MVLVGSAQARDFTLRRCFPLNRMRFEPVWGFSGGVLLRRYENTSREFVGACSAVGS
jgi:hypothetical protein